MTLEYRFAHLHYVLYDRRPSGQIVRLHLGAVPSGWPAREQAGLRTTARWTMSRNSARKWKPGGEQRDTQTVVMMGVPRSFQFRMNSRSSSILTCWMSLLRFSSDVPDSRKLDGKSEKTRWCLESFGPHFFNNMSLDQGWANSLTGGVTCSSGADQVYPWSAIVTLPHTTTCYHFLICSWGLLKWHTIKHNGWTNSQTASRQEVARRRADIRCTSEAEDVEQHSSDLVVGAVRVEQHGQQGPHGVLHLHTIRIWSHGQVLHKRTQTLLFFNLYWHEEHLKYICMLACWCIFACALIKDPFFHMWTCQTSTSYFKSCTRTQQVRPFLLTSVLCG